MSAMQVNDAAKDLANVVSRRQDVILAEWLKEMNASARRVDLIKDSDLRVQCAQFLELLGKSLDSGDTNFQSSTWDKVRDLLGDLSRSRAQQGFTPSETAYSFFLQSAPFSPRFGTKRTAISRLWPQ